MPTISYLDNHDQVIVTNRFTERGEGGGYIIYDLDGVSGEFFVPYNRVLTYPIVGEGLQNFIHDTNNSRIVPLSEIGNRVGGGKRKKKHKSKKKKSKKRKSKKRKSKKIKNKRTKNKRMRGSGTYPTHFGETKRRNRDYMRPADSHDRAPDKVFCAKINGKWYAYPDSFGDLTCYQSPRGKYEVNEDDVTEIKENTGGKIGSCSGNK
jgi:hypothetical protein